MTYLAFLQVLLSVVSPVLNEFIIEMKTFLAKLTEVMRRQVEYLMFPFATVCLKCSVTKSASVLHIFMSILDMGLEDLKLFEHFRTPAARELPSNFSSSSFAERNISFVSSYHIGTFQSATEF